MLELLSPLLESPLQAQAYLALANRYVYRGVTDDKHDAVASAALTLNNSIGWFLDGWVGRDANYTYASPAATNYITLEKPAWNDEKLKTSTPLQLDINAGYQFPLNANWRTAISHAWLVHNTDYQASNYQEWRLFEFYRSALSTQLAYSDNYRHFGWRYWNAEVQGFVGINSNLRAELGAGESIGENTIDHHIHYGWLGLRRDFQHFNVVVKLNRAELLEENQSSNIVEVSFNWSMELNRHSRKQAD